MNASTPIAEHISTKTEARSLRRASIAFEAVWLSDAATVVLRDAGPMRMMDLVFKLQERGYWREANIYTILQSLDRALKRNVDRSELDDEKRWRLR